MIKALVWEIKKVQFVIKCLLICLMSEPKKRLNLEHFCTLSRAKLQYTAIL